MQGDVTQWLARLRAGDEEAVDRLVPLLYAELKQVARRRMRGERRDHTLSTTGLVNEAYLKLRRSDQLRAEDRAQFLALAGTTMRRILVDYGRARRRQKRGGGREAVPLEKVEPLLAERPFLTDAEIEEVLSLDDALTRLEEMKPEAAEIVQHRFFAGLTLEETAEVLGVSVRTVQRRWIAARAWLRTAMRSG